MGMRQVISELKGMIREDDPDLQDALIEALRHPSVQVRTFAALHLADLFQDVRAAAALAEALHSGDHSDQRAAAGALWEIGDSDNGAMLDAMMRLPENQREAVANALYWIGWSPDDPRNAVGYYLMTHQWKDCIAMGSAAVPALIDALYDWDGAIRRGAAWALGEIGDAAAVPALTERLADEEGGMFGVGDRVCDVAAEALAKINTEDAWAALRWWRGEEG